MLQSSFSNNELEAGCDEAGRGCLSGPVFAAAVIFDSAYTNNLLNDSKLLSLKQRLQLRTEIESEARAWAVASVSPEKIDEINILNASILAMHKALDQLKLVPEFIIVDGNRFKNYKGISHTCIVKGDAKFLSIAAASVLAKTYRDDYMLELHRQFPEYGWNHNMGYPTREHKDAIILHGITPYHRKSYRLNEQLKISF
jgi:ribonuclease HII